MKKRLTMLLILLMASASTADSPLTSTPFHEAYMDLPVVADAVEAGMSREIYEVLMSDQYPLDVKVAGEASDAEAPAKPSQAEVLAMVERGEISVDKALELLKG